MVRGGQTVFVDLFLSFVDCMLPGVGDFSHAAAAEPLIPGKNKIKLLFYQMFWVSVTQLLGASAKIA
tara:strand:+ start:8620 stop:8820 length:201 start_codon:yes stop_codon:yes gene_type:complete